MKLFVIVLLFFGAGLVTSASAQSNYPNSLTVTPQNLAAVKAWARGGATADFKHTCPEVETLLRIPIGTLASRIDSFEMRPVERDIPANMFDQTFCMAGILGNCSPLIAAGNWVWAPPQGDLFIVVGSTIVGHLKGASPLSVPAISQPVPQQMAAVTRPQSVVEETKPKPRSSRRRQRRPRPQPVQEEEDETEEGSRTVSEQTLRGIPPPSPKGKEIARRAKAMLGSESDYGRHGCVDVATNILRYAGTNVPHMTAVSNMFAHLRRSPEWVQIPLEAANEDGDVFIAPQRGKRGHVLVQATNGRRKVLIGNSSRRGGVVAVGDGVMRTPEEFAQYEANRRGNRTYAYRHVGSSSD